MHQRKKKHINYSIRHKAKKLTDTLMRKSTEHFYTIHVKKRKNFSFFAVYRSIVKYIKSSQT